MKMNNCVRSDQLTSHDIRSIDLICINAARISDVLVVLAPLEGSITVFYSIVAGELLKEEVHLYEKIINSQIFAGKKKMCMYYFFHQEPKKHYTLDQYIMAAGMSSDFQPVPLYNDSV